MTHEQQLRVAANEDRFRAINEHTTAAIDEFRSPKRPDAYSVVCECAWTECVGMVELTPAEYAHVRSNGRWFAVLHGHVTDASIEVVVEELETHWIVEKRGAAGDFAAARA